MLDIGGGFPFKNSLSFEFDYEYMVDEIVKRIKEICAERGVMEPDLITEFGKYTVAEASGIVYNVVGRKQQNDRERWCMVDGSFITDLPDIWALNQRYILLPINNWNHTYEKVNLGGITCDGMDYYNQEAHINNQEKAIRRLFPHGGLPRSTFGIWGCASLFTSISKACFN